jgi:hypothetical protein
MNGLNQKSGDDKVSLWGKNMNTVNNTREILSHASKGTGLEVNVVKNKYIGTLQISICNKVTLL